MPKTQTQTTSKTGQDIIGLLKAVKKTANGWQARCPAHNDKTASLSISDGNQGAVLRCHAGCDIQDVIEALGLTFADLFTSPLNSNGHQAANQTQPKRKIKAEYDYCDEHNTLLFQAVRYDPKGFSQRRPDGNGGWIYNLKGIRAVLYRLPDLLKADPDATVFIVEGEKDVNALWDIDLVATCNPMGAGKWRKEYNGSLQGQDIVILPDNDSTGHAHAETVAQQLFGQAASIKILHLPGIPDKGDVSDWLTQGGDAEALCVMAENAPEWNPAITATAPSDDLLQSCGDFLTTSFMPREPIIHECGRGELAMFAAVTNRGKSTLLRNLALSLACGRELLPLVKAGPPRRVWLLDWETPKTILQADLRKMKLTLTDAEQQLIDKNLAITCDVLLDDEPFLLTRPDHLRRVAEAAKNNKSDVLIIDTLSAAFEVRDENSNSEVGTRVMKPMMRLARDINAIVLLAHHIGKSGSEEGSAKEKAHLMRGASAFAGFSSLIVNLLRGSSDDSSILALGKVKGEKFDDVTIKLDRDSRWFSDSKTPPPKTPTSYELLMNIFTDDKIWERRKIDAVMLKHFGKSTITGLISQAVQTGDLIVVRHGQFQSAKFAKQASLV